MARVIVSSPADADTVEIIAYLSAKAGHNIAASYIASFERLYDRLANYPRTGVPRPALGPQVRIGIVPPYIVIYEYGETDDAVTILRIVHGRRRITGKSLLTSLSSL